MLASDQNLRGRCFRSCREIFWQGEVEGCAEVWTDTEARGSAGVVKGVGADVLVEAGVSTVSEFDERAGSESETNVSAEVRELSGVDPESET